MNNALASPSRPLAVAAGSRAHFPPLDGLRGLAILMVLVHHCFYTTSGSPLARAVGAVVGAGWAGVNLFFVLSGFLISGILLDSAGRPHYYRNFYARRALRVFPLYYAFLLAYQVFAVAIAARVPGLGWAPRPASWPVFLFLTNTPEVFPVGAPSGPLGPLWSLAVEEQVYLFWPMLIAGLPRPMLLRVFGAMVPAALLWRCAILAGAGRAEGAYSWTPSCLDAFAAGGIVAILARDPAWRDRLRRSAATLATISGVGLLGLAAWLGHFVMWHAMPVILSVGLTGLSLFFSSMIALTVTTDGASAWNRGLSHPVLRGLGRYSFAMYLFHMTIFAIVRPPLLRVLGGLFGRESLTSSALVFAATLGATLLAAMASWRGLESPFLKLKAAFPTPGRGMPAEPMASPAGAVAAA